MDEVVQGERLRIVVLGMLLVSKGLYLLISVLDELAEFVDIHLVGVQEVGEMFFDWFGIHVIERYVLGEFWDIM